MKNGLARATLLLGVVAGGALAGVVATAQNAPAPLHIEKVKDNLFVITGGRGTGSSSSTVSGNTTVFVASTGVVLVDTKLPGFGAGILEQVRSVTSKPITTIINTHTHADHTGGNPELPRNVEHIAQQNTRANMAKMDLFKGANEGLLPTRTFTDRLSLLSGADRELRLPKGAGAPRQVGWSRDGGSLVVRAEGGLYRLDAPPAKPEPRPVSEAERVAAESSLAVLLGNPVFARVVPCQTGGELCVAGDSGAPGFLARGAQQAVRWGPDSVALLIGQTVEIRPLGRGRPRRLTWSQLPENPRQMTYFEGKGEP